MTGAYLHVLLVLAGVVGLIVVLGLVLRTRATGGNAIRVLAYQPLGARVGISLVRIGSEVLVLGVTPGGVTLIKTLDGAGFEEACGEGDARGGLFLRALRNACRRRADG